MSLTMLLQVYRVVDQERCAGATGHPIPGTQRRNKLLFKLPMERWIPRGLLKRAHPCNHEPPVSWFEGWLLGRDCRGSRTADLGSARRLVREHGCFRPHCGPFEKVVAVALTRKYCSLISSKRPSIEASRIASASDSLHEPGRQCRCEMGDNFCCCPHAGTGRKGQGNHRAVVAVRGSASPAWEAEGRNRNRFASREPQ